jgi:NitT/TauT family transport system permease protein
MADLPEARRFGGANAALQRYERWRAIDLALVLALGAIVFGVVSLARAWTGAQRPAVEIDLSPAALPRYTLYSLSRGLAAYTLALGFALVYGYWAAKDRFAGRVLIPLLDILQSIPVLGFMPGVVLALVAAFPDDNVGLELAAVIMIFTGQAWNMTFSVYRSLTSVPANLAEAATLFRFTWFERLRHVELPFATIGLVWNSMMSMAGGWFFLMISEAFVLGDRDFRLPGLGSYMSVAVARGDAAAMVWAVVAMVAMIVVLDQLLWRPAVAWAQRFRIDDGGQAVPVRSWFLELLRRSTLLSRLARRLRSVPPSRARRPEPRSRAAKLASRISLALFVVLLAVVVIGAWKLVGLLAPVTARDWLATLGAGFATLGRVLLSTALGTLWALPAGLAIGLDPKRSRVLQPVIQIAASFPAPMLFPAVIALLHALGVPLGLGSIVLMLLGTQWYILFNVVAGAQAIPADLAEAARAFRMNRLQRFRALDLPAVFPYLVTGWVTAAGGAWNASIVAEAITYQGRAESTTGLGAQISAAASRADFPLLAASILVMSTLVVAFNRIVWRRLNRLAETRFSLVR